MNVKRYRLINGILITLIIFSLSLYFLELYSITGHATEGTTYSNVTISKYFSISFSTELQAGIDFGTVATLPATNVNATQNYAGIGSETLYYVNISTDSNTPVDFCLRGISDMQSIAADVLGLGNESYGYSNQTNDTVPLPETIFTTSYVLTQENVFPGFPAYYRFWLDVPAAQPTGNYNNTISFKGITTGAGC